MLRHEVVVDALVRVEAQHARVEVVFVQTILPHVTCSRMQSTSTNYAGPHMAADTAGGLLWHAAVALVALTTGERSSMHSLREWAAKACCEAESPRRGAGKTCLTNAAIILPTSCGGTRGAHRRSRRGRGACGTWAPGCPRPCSRRPGTPPGRTPPTARRPAGRSFPCVRASVRHLAECKHKSYSPSLPFGVRKQLR